MGADLTKVSESPFEVYDISERKQTTDKIKFMNEHISHEKIFNIPQEMKQEKRFMYSTYRKQPCDNGGKLVSYKRSCNFFEFEELVKNNKNRLFYNYSLNNDFLVIDLDECIDKNCQLRNFAEEVLSKVAHLNPYIEYSASRKGLHIILTSTKSWDDIKVLNIKLRNKHDKYKDLPPKAGIDVFNNNHCITLTGDVYKGYNPSTLGKVNKELKEFYTNLVELDKKDKNKARMRYEKKKINKSVDGTDIYALINSKVSIEDVAQTYNIETQTYRNINCPFPDHEDSTPSFKLYEYSNSYHCFGCKKSGDVIGLVAEMEQIRQIDAAKKLNYVHELNIDFQIYQNNLDEEWINIDDDDKIHVDLISLRNHLFEEHHIYFTEHEIYIYDNGHYKMLEELQVKKLIEEHMPGVYNNKYKHSSYIDEVHKQLRRNFKSFKEFNKDKYRICFKNGFMNLKGNDKNILQENSPEYLETYQVNGNYNPDAKCNIWQDFLDFALPPEQQKVLQEILGYGLINNNKAKKFFCLYGVGDTGKSVVLEVLVKLVGSNYSCAMPLQDLTDKGNKFASSNLLGRMINVCGDLPDKVIEDTGVVKQLTSSTDMMKFEKKGCQSISDYNTARMYFSMNKLPAVKAKSKEFFNRLLMIKFENVCPESKIDRDITDKFDYEGILNWAVKGLQRLIENDLSFSTTKKNDKLVEAYRLKDSPVLEFFKDNIQVTNNDKDQVSQAELLEKFKYFCKFMINNEYAAKTKMSNFLEEINNNFSLKYSKNVKNPKTGKLSARGFKGIKFNTDFLEEFETQKTSFN